MEINSQVNTFLEGMNLDSDITMLSDKQYRWAQNVRLLTDNAGTTGILQNIEDIRQYLGGLEISENILGTAVSRWYNTDKEKVEECGIVFTKELYEQNRINNLWIVTDFNSISPTWTLIVSAQLNVTDNVSIVTNFESNNVSKVYISDGNTSIKCIIRKKFEYIRDKYKDINIDINDNVIDEIVNKCEFYEFGARRIDKIISKDIENFIIDGVISGDKNISIDSIVKKNITS